MDDINKYYEILGLKSGSSKEEIKQAYKDLLNIWNPSKHADDIQLQQKAQEKIKEIDNAYEKILLSLSQIPIDENESVQAEKSANIGTQQLARQPQEESSIYQKGFQKPRPWVRFWARTLDLNIFLLLSSVLIGFLYGFLYALINKEAPSFSDTILVLILLGLPIAFVIDAISMTLFGNTPGKAILRTSVTNADGSKLSFRDALLRNMRVYFSGYGLGIPLVQFVTFIVAYNKLTNKGKTAWDEKHNFIVSHGHIGGGRVLIYCVVFFIFLIITALLNNISQNGMKKWINTEIEKSTSINAAQAPAPTPSEHTDEPEKAKDKPSDGRFVFDDTNEREKAKAEAKKNIDNASSNAWIVVEETPINAEAKKNQDDARALYHYNIGAAYIDSGKHKEAIEPLKQAIRIKPDYVDAYYNLGYAYDESGKLREAIDAYKQAIRIKPDYTMAYYNLGAAYIRLDMYQEGIRALKQAINIKHDFAEAHYILGLVYIKGLNDKDSALEECRILKTLNGELADKLFERIYE